MAIFKKKQKSMTEEDYLKLERKINNLEETVHKLFNMAERYLNECSEQSDFRNYASEKIIDLSNQFMNLEDIVEEHNKRLERLEEKNDGNSAGVELDIGDLKDKIEKLEKLCHGTEENNNV